MRTALFYGAHGGDERITVDLGESIARQPVSPNVEALNVNPEACEQNVRIVDENFAYAVRHADHTSPILERRNGARAIDWFKQGAFEIGLDWHVTHYPGSEAAYLGYHCDRRLIKVAQYLGFSNIIFGDSGIQSVLPNVLGIDACDRGEPSPSELLREWRYEIKHLAAYENIDDLMYDYTPNTTPAFWEYVDAIPIDSRLARRLKRCNPYKDRGFSVLLNDELAEADIRALTDSSMVYAINTGDHYLDDGYLGEIVRQIPNLNDQSFLHKRLTRQLGASSIQLAA